LAEDLNATLLQPDADAKAPPRIRLSELGYPGLKTIQKQIMEESDSRLRMPQLPRTIAEMKKDSTISAALGLYRFLIGRVKWNVRSPVGATEQQKERTKFIKSCMDDLDEGTWFEFINSTLTMIEMGFAINEKVYKRCTKNNSKFDDGLVRWSSLAPRAQSTVTGWQFSDDGRKLLGVEQSTANIVYSERYTNLATSSGSKIVIPREKFLLFRTDPENGNPEGTSALKSAYRSWRMKQEIENCEVLGLSRDLSGLLKIQMPARYLSPDASTAEKAVAENFQRALRNISQGEQSGLILPSDADETTKLRMFDADLLQSTGARAFDTTEIINRYATQILISLFADVLQLGNNSTGSFALAGSKTNLLSFAIEYRLREIQNVINNDLVKQTFALNEWSDTELPEIYYEEVDPIDLEIFSKAVQRLAATSCIEKDRSFYNKVRESLGLDPFPEDEPVDHDLTGEDTSRSGDSFNTPTGGMNGTAKTVSEENTSDMNNENSA
jgi:hypothetical protein